jgi:RND family efflux transporter MFP subunit
LTGCGQKQPASAAPPPPAVSVAFPLQREVIEWDTYTGYLEAPESVIVAARVSGLITAAPFKEGAIIKKGDLLFVIDVRPFQADLDTKLADQARDEAQLALARITLTRLLGLSKDNAVSQQDIDNAKAMVDQAAATLAGAKAAVDASRLNVEWCHVNSPIDGRVSNKLVTVGNLINGGAGQATQLTTVQSVNPMYCYVDVDEHSVLKYQKLSAEKKRISARDGKVACFIQLANETTFPHVGVIDFVDNHVDPNTGTLRARGIIENSSGFLTPGFFARMRIPGSGRYQALLVPDAAIGNDQDHRTMLVVNKDNVAETRVVELGALFGDLRSIVSGLKPDDRVIINGQMHARPGSIVAPIEATFKVDPSTFSDPDSAAAQALPTTRAATADTSNPAPATGPGAEPTTGSTP